MSYHEGSSKELTDSYPNIRAQKAPAFLVRLYATTAGVFEAAAHRLGVEQALNVESVTAAFPDFEVLFDADNRALHEAILASIRGVKSPDRDLLASQLTSVVKRLLVFEDLGAVSTIIRQKLREVVKDFPRTLSQLEESGGGRDVLDPFIVALALRLLCADSLEDLLSHLVAHKCLMKLEDLIGHLHEEVLGRAAGKQRVSEPEGVVGADGKKNKEEWHPDLNPFPGADARLGIEEFYQIKNKTGSAKGSDGEKLGRQFKLLSEKYPGSKRFYVSMIGKTLAGHRSMGAFLRTDPGAEVLVGLAAFQQLGGHRDTPAIVLDFVLEEFEAVKTDLHYDFDAVIQGMLVEWRGKHGVNDPVHRLLHDMITPANPDEQQSGSYGRRRGVSKKSTKDSRQ